MDWFPALYSSTTCPPLSLDSGLILQDCVAGTPCTLHNRSSITCTVPNKPELADVMTQEVHAATVRVELWQDGKKLADCPSCRLRRICPCRREGRPLTASSCRRWR
ncbi:MAG: hypothetical protein V8Q30_08795 [Acutalibacteraceae bacterium]